jgi:large subunit ribosomal protein L23
MSEEKAKQKTPKAKAAAEAQQPKGTMTAEEATTLIIAPYVTEKTFSQIEKENKLAFIVDDKASKKDTARTIRGKKAFVRFKAAEGARELATKLGLV